MLIKGNRFIINGGRLALGGNKKQDPHYYTDEYTDYKYMTVVALEDDLEVSFPQNLQYCIDKSENWQTLSANTNSPKIAKGHTIHFKGDVNNLNTNMNSLTQSGIGLFTFTKKVNLSGNCNSLLFGDDADKNFDLSGYDSVYAALFANTNDLPTIVNVSKKFLPSTKLSDGCYYNMFMGCTSLTSTPELPATTLTPCCYEGIFRDCTSLINGPSVLSATTLAPSCYLMMFFRCTSLTSAPELPATTLNDNCYKQMFDGCTSLINGPSVLSATTLAPDCYYNMFMGCTSLTSTPELPATTLNDNCYYGMFRDCTSLVNAPQLPATTLNDYCYSMMFRGCTSLVTAPELPATTLNDHCYYGMFNGCSSLNNIKMLATDISAPSCLSSWVTKVSSTGTFVKSTGVEIPSGNSGIPNGWTVIEE